MRGQAAPWDRKRRLGTGKSMWIPHGDASMIEDQREDGKAGKRNSIAADGRRTLTRTVTVPRRNENRQFARLPTRTVAGAVEPESNMKYILSVCTVRCCIEGKKGWRSTQDDRLFATVTPLLGACTLLQRHARDPPLPLRLHIAPSPFIAYPTHSYARLGNHLPHPSQPAPLSCSEEASATGREKSHHRDCLVPDSYHLPSGMYLEGSRLAEEQRQEEDGQIFHVKIFLNQKQFGVKKL